MARPCSVCAHAKRREIDRLLVVGQEGNRKISKAYGLSEIALWRHKSDHIPERLAKAQEAIDVREALDVVTQLKAINGATFRVLQDAREAGDGELVLKAVDRVQRQIELQAKLLGELDDRPQIINVSVHPAFVEARVVLLRALLPYPDARAAAAAALLALDQEDGDRGRRN